MTVTIQGATLTGCTVSSLFSCDPYYSNVSLLLPMNGANNSTTFTDYSPSPKTVTATNDAKISTAFSKWGGSSGYFAGDNDYLISPSDAAFNLSNQDFTIEGWFRASAIGSNNAIISNCDATVNEYFLLWLDSSGFIKYQIRDASSQFITTGTTAISANTWYHIAWCRSGNNFYGFVNGASDQTSTSTKSLTQRPILVGGFIYLNFWQYWNGYLQDIRVTKGVARYTSTFTPPTAAFPTIAC